MKLYMDVCTYHVDKVLLYIDGMFFAFELVVNYYNFKLKLFTDNK